MAAMDQTPAGEAAVARANQGGARSNYGGVRSGERDENSIRSRSQGESSIGSWSLRRPQLVAVIIGVC